MAEASRHLLESRRDAMEEIAKLLHKIPDEHRQDFLDAAIRRVEKQPKPDAEEIRQFMSSLDGAKFLLWMMLQMPSKLSYPKSWLGFLRHGLPPLS